MITQKQRSALTQALDTFVKKGKTYEIGSSLLSITEAIACVIGEQEIIIYLPYGSFRCKGKAKQVYEDVLYLTPFMGGNCCDINHTSTLFYGETKCKNGNYMPFQSDCDVFHVASCTHYKKRGDVVIIRLEKGMSWRALL